MCLHIFVYKLSYLQDLQTIDLEPFMYAGTNITGIRFFDPESQEIQDMVKFWNKKEKERDAKEIAAETLLVTTVKI